jgi:hypothetical protein
VSIYFNRLRETIRASHEVDSIHLFSAPVKEESGGQVTWEGNVEVFSLSGHPKADRCYAWGYQDEGGEWLITSVLGVPPVISPQMAVQVAIAADAKRATLPPFARR